MAGQETKDGMAQTPRRERCYHESRFVRGVVSQGGKAGDDKAVICVTKNNTETKAIIYTANPPVTTHRWGPVCK